MYLQTPPEPCSTAAREDNTDYQFRRIIDNFFHGNLPQFCPAERVWNPPTDVFETANAIHIKMEIAGVRDEDLEVKVTDNLLVIRGRRTDEQHTKKENFHLMEIHYGTFERVFGLPRPMEVKDVTARLKDGFLLVTIPKDIKVREYRIGIE
ncbi:MAG: Hsp20/alpha crystallin family protein [Candidatus Sumerlaeaceae bacterium]